MLNYIFRSSVIELMCNTDLQVFRKGDNKPDYFGIYYSRYTSSKQNYLHCGLPASDVNIHFKNIGVSKPFSKGRGRIPYTIL